MFYNLTTCMTSCTVMIFINNKELLNIIIIATIRYLDCPNGSHLISCGFHEEIQWVDIVSKEIKKENRPYIIAKKEMNLKLQYDVVLKWKEISDGKSYCFNDFEKIQGIHQKIKGHFRNIQKETKRNTQHNG
ncbi:hypothetical protein EDI_024670 [Entamoeba dispar SAW760]|uniref:Uncharacterized protein n=1 Tax=Entamoeba dispar (strain ATCC PRA-260 / SAW760) TaxID=370354 RepID=B0ETS2_ENTDS|nr:uncharacterized protein EDI_024670 [Entamoeba dispar SAW760]EDR22075.1 hypothetical protein EDI_024670 [Entamoeba dispar SAW760]|eukprot:EDR22075.1 hypothetical protein EDI_024670 [Entamoeba dispar SAW760]